MRNLRAAGTWIATPVALFGLWLLEDWFLSTNPGILVALTVGPLLLVGVALMVAGVFYVLRE